MANTKSQPATSGHPMLGDCVIGLSVVLAFLLAAPLATKFVNGYLLCDYMLSMFYLDLAIGVAMLSACGIILLLAFALNRVPTTIPGRCFRCVALVLIFALLLAYVCGAVWNFALNFNAVADSSRDARISSQAEFDEVQPHAFLAKKKQFCSEIADVYQFPDIDLASCMQVLDDAWPKPFGHRQDPFNLCASNNNETIKAIFQSDKATFQLTHRVDAVFKFAAGIEWMAVFFAGLAAAVILAFNL